MAIDRSGGTLRRNRYALVRAGSQFLFRALPVRKIDSSHALLSFVRAAKQCDLPPADTDAVLIRCLAVLERRLKRRAPRLVERYIERALSADCIQHFSVCVDDALAVESDGDSVVDHAIEVVNTRFADPTLMPRTVARTVGRRLSTLCVEFRRDTGSTLSEHIRAVRLDRAAALLLTRAGTAKEAWAEVGYNHASNFTHDFKQRFGVTPGEYLQRRNRPRSGESSAAEAAPIDHVQGSRRVLVVDDDENCTTAIATFLSTHGHSVRTAASAAAALAESKQQCPDVLLSEHWLPDCDGLEFLRDFQCMQRSAASTFSFLTADWAVYEKASEVHKLGAVIASKLCDLDDVLNLVTR